MWLLMLKGRRSILSSHTAATGLAKLCPTSTSRMPWKTAGPDTLPLVPSTLDPSRLLRWSACPPSTSLTNYIFWRRITGISQKRRIVRSVGPPPTLCLIDPTKELFVLQLFLFLMVEGDRSILYYQRVFPRRHIPPSPLCTILLVWVEELPNQH